MSKPSRHRRDFILGRSAISAAWEKADEILEASRAAPARRVAE